MAWQYLLSPYNFWNLSYTLLLSSYERLKNHSPIRLCRWILIGDCEVAVIKDYISSAQGAAYWHLRSGFSKGRCYMEYLIYAIRSTAHKNYPRQGMAHMTCSGYRADPTVKACTWLSWWGVYAHMKIRHQAAYTKHLQDRYYYCCCAKLWRQLKVQRFRKPASEENTVLAHRSSAEITEMSYAHALQLHTHNFPLASATPTHNRISQSHPQPISSAISHTPHPSISLSTSTISPTTPASSSALLKCALWLAPILPLNPLYPRRPYKLPLPLKRNRSIVREMDIRIPSFERGSVPAAGWKRGGEGAESVG